MKKIHLTILAVAATVMVSFACSSSSTGSEKEPEPVPEEAKIEETIRVMAYNIHHANPPSKEDVIDIDAIVNAIKAENPDVVALQEVDSNTERSGEGNQAQMIAEALGMNWVYGKAIDYEGGEYGVAILSKFKIADKKVNTLPTISGTNGEPRILLTVKLTTDAGNTILFGSTHLDAQKEHTNRLVQIEKIVDIAESVDLPFIVAGDFNAVSDTEVIRILDSHFDRTCRLCPPTIPATTPNRAIDYIAYTHPDGKFTSDNHKVVGENYASDHRPIVADINIME